MGKNDYLNLLYLPYTFIVFSFIIDGILLSHVFHFFDGLLLLIAYFFGLGLSAHYLNEAYSHRIMTVKHTNTLKIIGEISLALSIIIGGYLVIITHNLELLVIGIIEVISVIFYNHPTFKIFHNDLFFSLTWGGLPSLAGFVLSLKSITLSAMGLFIITSLLGSLEITPSRHVKYWRRQPYDIDKVVLKNGEEIIMNREKIIERPERSIKLLAVLTYMFPIFLYLLLYFKGL